MVRLAIQSFVSAVITLIIIWLLKRSNVPFLSGIAREI